MRQVHMTEILEGTAALSKGISLLRAIVRDDGATGVGELGEALGIPRTTAHRLIAELQRQGLVMRTRRGRYAPGFGLISLAAELSVERQLAHAARQPLEDIAAKTGLTAHLGVLENDMVTYLVKSQASRSADIFTREKGQLEAYCSGIGKVLLAHLPDSERSAYLASGPFVPLTPHTLVDPIRLEAALDAVKDTDFAADESEIALGLRCLAVPVRDPDNKVLAAISLSITDRDTPPADDVLLDLLRATAALIGERLVSRPPDQP